jgi:hypothetical protein
MQRNEVLIAEKVFSKCWFRMLLRICYVRALIDANICYINITTGSIWNNKYLTCINRILVGKDQVGHPKEENTALFRSRTSTGQVQDSLPCAHGPFGPRRPIEEQCLAVFIVRKLIAPSWIYIFDVDHVAPWPHLHSRPSSLSFNMYIKTKLWRWSLLVIGSF